MARLRPPTCDHDWALFLDLDGTLLEIAETPASVRVPERLKALIACLRDRLDGALAVVSGRSIANLDELLAPLRLPAAGAHGAERRDAAGRLHRMQPDGALAAPRDALAALVARHPALLLEDKGSGLALHYRRAPALEPAARAAVAAALASLGPAFQLVEGKSVLEIAPRAASKAGAIEQFMLEAPFRGRTAAFVGDDVTDESGFAVVNRLGGHSVKVGEHAATGARWRLESVGAVIRWLESCSAERTSEGPEDARTKPRPRGHR